MAEEESPDLTENLSRAPGVLTQRQLQLELNLAAPPPHLRRATAAPPPRHRRTITPAHDRSATVPPSCHRHARRCWFRRIANMPHRAVTTPSPNRTRRAAVATPQSRDRRTTTMMLSCRRRGFKPQPRRCRVIAATALTPRHRRAVYRTAAVPLSGRRRSVDVPSLSVL